MTTHKRLTFYHFQCIYGISICVKKKYLTEIEKFQWSVSKSIFIWNTERDRENRKERRKKSGWYFCLELDDWPKCRKIVHMFCFVAFDEHIPCFSQTYSFWFFVVVVIFQFKLSKCVKCFSFVVILWCYFICCHTVWSGGVIFRVEEFRVDEREIARVRENRFKHLSHCTPLFHCLLDSALHCTALHCATYDSVWVVYKFYSIFDFRHGHFGQECMSAHFYFVFEFDRQKS